MERITTKQLEGQIEYINEITESKYTYTLEGAYGGYKLCVRTERGLSDMLYTGFTTKKNLYNNLRSFIQGLEIKNTI